jgi:hypothetical protein
VNKTFEAALEKLEAHKEGCWDRKLGSVNMVAQASGSIKLDNGKEVHVHPTQYALQRLLGRLTTKSSAYANARPHVTLKDLQHLCTRPALSNGRLGSQYGSLEGPVFARIFNTILHEFHPAKKWLIRCRDKEGTNWMRAALSDEFRPFDHMPFMRAILNPDLGMADHGEVKNLNIGRWADDMYLKVIFKDLRVDVDGGEYFPGYRFTNGELGNRRIGFQPFIFTRACTNDAIGMKEYEWFHQHRGKWATELLTQALGLSAQEWFKKATGHIEDFVSLKDFNVPNMGAIIKQVKKKHALSDESVGFLKAMVNQAEVRDHASSDQRSAWAIVNGVTAYARQIPDADKRDDLERTGGSLIEQFVGAMKADAPVKVRLTK